MSKGRPLTGAKPKQRYQVMLHPEIAERARARYAGNLSAAIGVALRVMLSQPGPVNPIWPKRKASSGGAGNG